MTILNQILIATGVRKTQTTFLNILFALWLAIPGRINYANLERFSNLNEKTFRNWFEKPVEWVHLNANLVRALQAKTRMGNRLILAVDATSNRKAGKCTPGLAKFWDSKLGKATQSLELSCCTLIDLEYRQAIPIHAWQTPAVPPEGESRVDHYAGHMQDVLGTLHPEVRAQIVCVVGDAYYAKKTFVDGVTGSGKHFVSKLRSDANLRYLYDGPATGKPGRPQKYAGKVIWSDLSSWTLISSDEVCSICSSCAYSPALRRNVLVVCVTWFGLAGKTRREIFFSTDLPMPALEVIECYRARFEMEFSFRDAKRPKPARCCRGVKKQFAGLMDSQSRQAKALEFHWNASFAVVSLARVQALLAFDGDVRDFVFSMEDAVRRGYNEFFAARIIRLLPLSLSFDKCVALLEDALNLGVKAA